MLNSLIRFRFFFSFFYFVCNAFQWESQSFHSMKQFIWNDFIMLFTLFFVASSFLHKMNCMSQHRIRRDRNLGILTFHSFGQFVCVTCYHLSSERPPCFICNVHNHFEAKSNVAGWNCKTQKNAHKHENIFFNDFYIKNLSNNPPIHETISTLWNAAKNARNWKVHV